ARSIPQASASTKSGKWEKKKFLGSELRGKILGIVGLGSVGREVVSRARAFGMRVAAYDPFVTSLIAADLDVSLVSLNELYAQSDYITLHVSLTPDTENMLSAAAFAKMKPGVRIVNCARGELVDDTALQAAIESGKVAGAALDVFTVEPTTADYPLFMLPQTIATPHIGGSTEEAQEIVGVRIAEQMVEYLKNGIALNAVNMPALSPEQYRALGPYIDIAEKLGNFAAQLALGNPRGLKLTYFGRIATLNTSLLRNAALAGLLRRSAGFTGVQRANVVNAMQIASERGWAVTETHDKRPGGQDAVRLELETEAGTTVVEGAWLAGRARLLYLDGIYCEAPLSGHLICMKNLDVPGVIGHVGNVLGRNAINIANFSLGRREEGPNSGRPSEAIAVVSTDAEVPDQVLRELMENPAVTLARSVEFVA
ncbi:MAG: phosphoglycerate dehydrogenase, partial [Acidobacteriota bacterium]|nr:phosphoglycerate dehydrogenase [Acidobacteriota bacterium]